MDNFIAHWTLARWPKPGEIAPFFAEIEAEKRAEKEIQERRERPKIEAPVDDPEQRARVAEGLARIRRAEKNGWCDQMTDDEWWAWCKSGIVPNRLHHPAE